MAKRGGLMLAQHWPGDLLMLVFPAHRFENQHLGDASVLDVAPTVAHLLGLPVARDLPGEVLSQAFRPGGVLSFPVREVESWE